MQSLSGISIAANMLSTIHGLRAVELNLDD
jgi:hypothetical protein